MDDKELHILFAIGVVWNVISIYFCKDLGITFGFDGWILSNWLFSYFLGYYSNRVITSKNEKILYICGAIGCVCTIIAECTISARFSNPYDLSIVYIIFSLASYVFLSRHINVNGAVIKRVISFIAKHSFSVYLVHNSILNNLVEPILNQYSINSNTLYFFLSISITFMTSFIVAIILDTIVFFPIAKLVREKLY